LIVYIATTIFVFHFHFLSFFLLYGYQDARADYGPNPFAGVAGNINIWKPKILQDQVSIGYMAVSGGPIEEDFASISVGWIVS